MLISRSLRVRPGGLGLVKAAARHGVRWPVAAATPGSRSGVVRSVVPALGRVVVIAIDSLNGVEWRQQIMAFRSG